MQRKSYLKSMSVLTLTACLISGYVVKDIAMLHAVSASEKKANNVSPRENLYRAVNDNWLANTKLKQGQTSVNSFSEIEDKLKQLLVSDMAKMASGKIETTNDEQKKMVAYYKQGMDFKELIEKLVGPTNKAVNVEDKTYFKQVNDVINSKQLANMKAWMMISMLVDQSDFLGEQNRQAASAFKNVASGLTQIESKEKMLTPN